MTKADIARRIMTAIDCTFNEASDYVEATLEEIKLSLEGGESVKITRFGRFEIKQKSDRRGRNPQTGEQITIASRKIVTFKPSHLFRQDLNAK